MLLNKLYIDPSGATRLLLAMLVAKLFSMVPRTLATRVGTSAWLVMTLAGVVALGGYWLLQRLLNRFPGRSLIQINREVLGRPAGAVVSLLYIGYFVYLSGLFVREFEASFRIAVLPATPASALLLLFLGTCLFASFIGIEAIARMATYLFPVLLGLWFIPLLGTLRLLDVRQLAPFFGVGVMETLLMPLPESSLYSEVLTLGILAGSLRPREVGRVGWNAMVGAILIQGICMAILGAAFPFPALSRLHFPMLDLVRAIEFSEFVQRVESVFIFLWFFVAGFKLCTLLLCSAISFAQLAGVSVYRPLLVPLTLIVYTIAFLPPDVVTLAWLDSNTLRLGTWPVSFGLPALTLLVAVLRRKGGAAREQAPEAAT